MIVVGVLRLLSKDCAILGVNLYILVSDVYVEDKPTLVEFQVYFAHLSARGCLSRSYCCFEADRSLVEEFSAVIDLARDTTRCDDTGGTVAPVAIIAMIATRPAIQKMRFREAMVTSPYLWCWFLE